MILVDQARTRRARENRPIRVGLVGAGFMARGLVHQLARHGDGIEVAAILCRNPEKGRALAAEAGAGGIRVTDDPDTVTDDPRLEVLVEATGSLEYAAGIVTRAIAQGKHLVLMNAELDGTVGPVLKVMADRAGVVYSGADGDQPAVQMNLHRFVRGIGLRPVLCGNIKGLHDPSRTPATQESFARRWGQNPRMVTSFADGTKISFEQAIVANATGMRVARRGMLGPTVAPGTPVDLAAREFPAEVLLEGSGIVDYLVGASPAPGVFLLATTGDPVQRHYLELYKLGPGPLYCFHTPCHLCHFEVPNTIVRVADFGDAAIAPAAGPLVEVVAVAKRDLVPGELVDGLGGFMLHGVAENRTEARREDLLPIGLAEGGRILRPVARGQVLTRADLALPAGRILDRLRAEQDRLFDPDPAAESAPGPA